MGWCLTQLVCHISFVNFGSNLVEWKSLSSVSVTETLNRFYALTGFLNVSNSRKSGDNTAACTLRVKSDVVRLVCCSILAWHTYTSKNGLRWTAALFICKLNRSFLNPCTSKWKYNQAWIENGIRSFITGMTWSPR